MLSKPAVMLMGLIREKPINAYEIVKQLNVMNVKWWYNIAESTVYATLKSLEKKGFIKGTAEKVGNAPDRTVYRLSETGYAEFVETIKHCMLQFDYDANTFSIAAFFLDVLPLKEQQLLLQKRISILQAYRNGIEAEIETLEKNGTPPLHIANTKRMVALVNAELSGASYLLEAIKNL